MMQPNEPYTAWPRSTVMDVHQLARVMEQDTMRLCIVFLGLRPEIYEAIVKLEKRLYPPGTDKNKYFEIWCTPWQGLPFAIATVPLTDRHVVTRELDEQSNMTLEDGVPTLLRCPGGEALGSTRGKHPQQIELFPINTPRVFTLAPNHAKAGKVGQVVVAGMAFRLDPSQEKKVMDEVIKDVDRIVKKAQARRN